MARLVHVEVTTRSNRSLNLKIIWFELGGRVCWAEHWGAHAGRAISSASGQIGYRQRRGSERERARRGGENWRAARGECRERWGRKGSKEKRAGSWAEEVRMTWLWLSQRFKEVLSARRASLFSISERCRECKRGQRANIDVSQRCITRHKS